LSWDNNESHFIRPEKPQYNNVEDGYIHKFRHWYYDQKNIQFNEFVKLNNVEPVEVLSNFYITFLELLFQSKELIKTPGSLSFRDPWYITVDTVNCTYSQDTTFRTIAIPDTGFNFGDFSYGGIFLDQDPSVPGSPYYSLRASKYLDINGSHKWPGDTLDVGESFFTGWSVAPADSSAFIVTDPDTSHQEEEYDTKAVIFKEAGAEITANYKAHLITGKPSSSSESRSALSPNSQRKVDCVATQNGQSFQDGLYQAVYESAGEVCTPTECKLHGRC